MQFDFAPIVTRYTGFYAAFNDEKNMLGMSQSFFVGEAADSYGISNVGAPACLRGVEKMAI